VTDIGILALVPDDWRDPWQRRHQILGRLAARFPVAWVSAPQHWRPWLARRWRGGARVQTLPDARMLVLSRTDGLPTLNTPRAVMHAQLRRRVMRAERWLRQQGCRHIEVEIWRPELGVALDWVSHATSTYHIDDEYSWSDTPQPMSAVERSLIARVDRVFVTSPRLMETKGGINPRTIYSPNGVDFDAFASEQPQPHDLAGIPHPRVGFIGVLHRGIDWDLLAELATRHAAWSFVIVGGVREGHESELGALRAMARLPNVHLLGERPSEALPAYVQHVDVSLLPYRRLAYMEAINPLKLYEALASGTPVVGAHIPAIDALTPIVSTSAGADEWGDAIADSLTSDARSPSRRAERQSVARQHDWNAIAAAIGDEVAAALQSSS
jgi:glycosyltransferase involved in cell wall biosynthesis